MSSSKTGSVLQGAIKDTMPVAWFVIPFCMVIALWITAYPVMMKWHHDDIGKAGQTGDMFGMYNTLFTGLALVGLIYTIKLQRDEVRLAKADAEVQRAHIEHQQFESTFFQLLKMFENAVTFVEQDVSMYVRRGGRVDDGDGTARAQHAIFHLSFNLQTALSSKTDDSVDVLISHFFLGNEKQLGRYYGVFYQILEWLEQSCVSNKIFYANTFRSILSQQEVFLIYCKGALPEETELRKYLEKYGLLKHLPAKLRDAFPTIKVRYAKSAFLEARR